MAAEAEAHCGLREACERSDTGASAAAPAVAMRAAGWGVGALLLLCCCDSYSAADSFQLACRLPAGLGLGAVALQ